MDTKRIILFVVALVVFIVLVVIIINSFKTKCATGYTYDKTLKKCRIICTEEGTTYYDEVEKCLKCAPNQFVGTDGNCTTHCDSGLLNCGQYCYNVNTQKCMPDGQSVCNLNQYCKAADGSVKCCKKSETCENGVCTPCSSPVICGQCCKEGERCSDDDECCLPELMYTTSDGKTHCCHAQEALCPRENPTSCCQSNTSCDPETDTCAVLCGGEYCHGTDVCEILPNTPTSYFSRQSYCRPVGCVWAPQILDPPAINNKLICAASDGSKYFCSRSGQPLLDNSINVNVSDPTQIPECSKCLLLSEDGTCIRNACDARLSQQGLNSAYYDSKTGTCKGVYDCSRSLPSCDNFTAENIPEPDKSWKYCKDKSGNYTGKFCEVGTCLADGNCYNFSCNQVSGECEPVEYGYWENIKDCQEATHCSKFDYPETFLVQSLSDKCLDANNSTTAYLSSSCDKNNGNQVWSYSTNKQQIYNSASKKCLECDTQGSAQMVDCVDNLPSQLFEYNPVTQQIFNVAQPSVCLTPDSQQDGARLALKPCTDSTNQTFTFSSTAPVWPDKFGIVNVNTKARHCMDAHTGDIVWNYLTPCSDTNPNQVWYHDPQTQKLYIIYYQGQKYCIDDNGSTPQDNKPIQVKDCVDGDPNQEYAYDWDKQQIINKAKGMCIDSQSTDLESKYYSKVCGDGNANQTFIISKT